MFESSSITQTLRISPHYTNTNEHRYDEKATLKRLLVPYGYTRMCKTFKYDRLPVPITELEGAESFDIVLRKQNGDIVKKTTYMTYGNTFADVLEQLERYVCCSMKILTNIHTNKNQVRYIENREIRRTISNTRIERWTCRGIVRS